jgi:hypothetical protein
MSATKTSSIGLHVDEAAEDGAIRPFRVNVPEEKLDDLRRRISATRWPDRDTVVDRSQGVQLARLRPLIEYWGTGYEWRNLIYYRKLDAGGLFAPWERPELFSEEVQAAFTSLH